MTNKPKRDEASDIIQGLKEAVEHAKANRTRDLFKDGFTADDFVDEDLVENVVARANQLLRAALAEAQVVYDDSIPEMTCGMWVTEARDYGHAHTARLVAIEALGEGDE